jgi:hypothetical protein
MGENKNKTVSYDDFTKRYMQVNADGELIDSITPSTATYTLPKIGTKEGNALAQRMAAKVKAGLMDPNSVPHQYKFYVDATLNGMATSEGISRFGEKFAPILAATAAAPFAIGGLATGIGTGAFGNAGRFMLNKADDAVAWLSKSGTRWYDPRHIVQTVFNPTNAYTGLGEAGAATLDLAGAGYSLKQLGRVSDDIRANGFNINHTPELLLNTAGTLPFFNYGTRFAKPVVTGVTRL